MKNDGKKMGDKELPNFLWNSRFFNNPKYSDVTIKIFDLVLPAHRIVICDQSDYFEKALQKGSRQFLEAETQTIEFNEGSGAAHWRVFEYLYTGDYSDQLSTTGLTDDPELLKDVRVFALADMFFIESLKTLAEVKFTKRIKDRPIDDSFLTCVREVYKSTRRLDSPMRRAVAMLALHKSRALAHDYKNRSADERINLNNFRLLMEEGGNFAGDYLLCSIGLKPTHPENSKSENP